MTKFGKDLVRNAVAILVRSRMSHFLSRSMARMQIDINMSSQTLKLTASTLFVELRRSRKFQHLGIRPVGLRDDLLFCNN